MADGYSLPHECGFGVLFWFLFIIFFLFLLNNQCSSTDCFLLCWTKTNNYRLVLHKSNIKFRIISFLIIDILWDPSVCKFGSSTSCPQKPHPWGTFLFFLATAQWTAEGPDKSVFEMFIYCTVIAPELNKICKYCSSWSSEFLESDLW